VRPSGYSASKLDQIAEELNKDHLRAFLGAANVGVLLLAAPAIFGALALLALRLGGLNGGLGVCSAYGAAMRAGGLGGLVVEPGSRAPPQLALERVVNALEGGSGGGGGALPLAAVGAQLQAAFGAAFWRPVLSFALWFLLAASVAMQEIGWLFSSLTPHRTERSSSPAVAEEAPAAPSAAAAAAEAAAAAQVVGRAAEGKKDR
jgi:hypothetical protein